MAVSASTAFPLGVFVGNPNADDPAAEAVFDASYKAFTTLMGVQATYMDAYGDSTQPIDEWASNASWSASSYENSPVAKTMIPVIGLPMSSTAAGQPSADQTFKNFAAGDYDSMLQSMVKSWAAAGFLTQYWRPGVEMNLAGSPSYAGSDAATQADWVAAFQHIYTVLHAAAAADGVKLQVIWNPGVGNDSAVGDATQTIYPGNNYVDIIGADVYGEIHPYGTPTALYDWDKSGQVLDSSKPVYDSSVQQWASDPVNLAHYYTYPASDQWALDGSGGSDLSLQNLIDFAKAQGKPIAIPETGAGNNDGSGVSDNPTFVQWLYNTLTTSGVPVSFVNIWDSNGGGTYEFSQTADDKPLEAAAWAKYFGAQSGTSTGSQTGTLSVTPTTTSVTTTDAVSAKVFSAIVVSDTNSGQTETVSVTPSTTANGTLSDPNAATDGSKIANGIWTVTGSAAAVAAALDGLTFKPTAHEVAPGKSVTTTFTALIKDTAGLTTTTSSTLTATAVATPITVTPATSSVATTGVANAKVFSGVVITDPNSGQSETATVTPSTLLNGTLVDPNAATDGSKITNGIWSITGSATAVATAMNGLTFKPIAQAVTTNTAATTTFSAVIKDTAGLSASAKSTVTATTQVTSISISVSPATESVATANTSSTKVFSGLVISDSNSGQTESVTVTPSTTVNGVLSDPNAATDGGKITNGVWTATGSSAAMATALNGLVFTPNATQAAGTALTTTFTASIKDTLGQTASAKTAVTANAAASISPTTTTIGSGSDTVVLNVNEDYYLGNAQFTVSVDGTRIGGTQTATAIHSLGQSQTFDIKGSFGVGAHTVAVDFLNDAYGGSASTDRNLYVTSASYDGVAASDASLILASAGTQSFTVGTPASVATTIGSGTDTIALGMSEDAYLGNAQFTVSVDGKQIGGTQTATALDSLGQTQTLDVKGTFGAGTHTVAVDFLNDAYGGSATEDRNLFVTSASYDGVAASHASLTLASSGVQTITVGTQAPLAAALQVLSTTAQNSTDTGQTTYTPGAVGGDITTSTGDTVQVGTGNVTVHASGASVTVFGGDGALTFIGGSGTDTVTGAAGDMIIKASNAILKFTAGAGNATITAGSKSEALTIINGQAGGLITISDFNAHLDSFHLQGYAAGTATQKIEGGSTDITLSDHTQIVLVGTVLTHSLFA